MFELIYATFCENEGKQIRSRTQEFNKRFPPHGGNLLKLNHVEPMVPIELFQDVREKAEVFGKEILDAFMRPNFLNPRCGLCGERMRLIGRSIVRAGRFICRNNHPSVSIQLDELDDETKKVLQYFIDNISVNSIEKITRGFLEKQLERIETELQKLYNAIDNEYVRFCLNFSPMETSNPVESKMELIKGLENERLNYLVKKYNTEIVLQEIDRLVSLLHNKTKGYLDSAELETLSRLVIESIRVTPEELHFNLFFEDLMKKEVAQN
ncbi:hypothetical protein [Brevibacillus thermoruber]|uniref:hypothetical protein n=1 Tax=Brevibacillus thermoruber TaxID=33942 RepID=UPI0005578CC0|nr:hypothetical protein [Brevibacillus thermoruber]